MKLNFFILIIILIILIILILVVSIIKSKLLKTDKIDKIDKKEFFEVDCKNYSYLCFNEYPEILKQYSEFPLLKTINIIDANQKVK